MLVAKRAIADYCCLADFGIDIDPRLFSRRFQRAFCRGLSATNRLRDILVGTDFGWSFDSSVEKSKYARKCTYVIMAHKTLTISEEAYNALARIKSNDESFTKVILRLTQKKSKGNLLDYVRSFPPDNELADRIEEVLEKRGSIRIRASRR